MKKQKLIIFVSVLIILLVTFACLTQKSNKQKQFPVSETTQTTVEETNEESIELPEIRPQDMIILHAGFTLSYNEKHEQASWVAYELTREELEESVTRTDNFLPDPNIKTGSAENTDYKGSGFDRGHLAPAADMKWSVDAMKASFYYSNMSPQAPAFNRGIWKKAEETVRHWADIYEGLYVVTGPVLHDNLKAIGKNKVSVPASYYKIVLDKNKTKALAFLMPNEGSKQPLYHFCVSVDSIERLTGIDFYPSLNDSLEQKLESSVDFNAWTNIYE